MEVNVLDLSFLNWLVFCCFFVLFCFVLIVFNWFTCFDQKLLFFLFFGPGENEFV